MLAFKWTKRIAILGANSSFVMFWHFLHFFPSFLNVSKTFICNIWIWHLHWLAMWISLISRRHFLFYRAWERAPASCCLWGVASAFSWRAGPHRTHWACGSTVQVSLLPLARYESYNFLFWFYHHSVCYKVPFVLFGSVFFEWSEMVRQLSSVSMLNVLRMRASANP